MFDTCNTAAIHRKGRCEKEQKNGLLVSFFIIIIIFLFVIIVTILLYMHQISRFRSTRKEKATDNHGVTLLHNNLVRYLIKKPAIKHKQIKTYKKRKRLVLLPRCRRPHVCLRHLQQNPLHQPPVKKTTQVLLRTRSVRN